MLRSRLRKSRAGAIHLEAALQMREYSAIADRIAGDRPGRLLDWGCGQGQVLRLLRRRGVDVSGFEHRPGLEGIGKERLPRYPELEIDVSPDPVALPFEPDRFDSVLSCGVLEHVPDPDASLEEIRRVLRPRGALYVYKLPNRFSYLERVARMAGLPYHGCRPNDRVYRRSSAVDLLSRHGFTVTEVRHANMLPLTVRRGPLQRFPDQCWRVNRALGRLPAVRVLATDLELVAIAPGD